jgi:hypothetical protein
MLGAGNAVNRSYDSKRGWLTFSYLYSC